MLALPLVLLYTIREMLPSDVPPAEPQVSCLNDWEIRHDMAILKVPSCTFLVVVLTSISHDLEAEFDDCA